MVKMARAETFQMSIDWLSERRLLRMAARHCADRASSVAENVAAVAWKPTNGPQAMGSLQPSLLGQPRHIQESSCSRFTRLLLVQLIFLVTDRSRNHGHAP
jgi:hypothetical protein